MDLCKNIYCLSCVSLFCCGCCHQLKVIVAYTWYATTVLFSLLHKLKQIIKGDVHSSFPVELTFSDTWVSSMCHCPWADDDFGQNLVFWGCWPVYMSIQRLSGLSCLKVLIKHTSFQKMLSKIQGSYIFRGYRLNLFHRMYQKVQGHIPSLLFLTA